MGRKLVEEYIAQGRFVQVNEQTEAFVYEKGKGEAVLCFHGVPASSFVYKEVVDGLAERNIRGIAFDLLGAGASSRPLDADYSWTGLGLWCCELIEKMELKEFHILMHGIGGHVACEVIHRMPERILSITILNTQIINLHIFRKPFPIFLYEKKGLGEFLMRLTTPGVVKTLMRLRGVGESEKFGLAQAEAWIHFIKGQDKGKSYLKILRSFEITMRKETFYINILKQLDVPKQIIWGVNDPGLDPETYAYPLQEQLNIYDFAVTNGSHFVQIDYADIIVKKINQSIRYNYGRKRNPNI